MGVEPFLISSSVLAMMAQRLVRVLCQHCKEPDEVNLEALKEVGITQELLDAHGGQVYRGRGCEACRSTGYRGRMGIYELLPIDDPIRSLIMQQANAHTIKAEAMERGLKTLLQDGALKVLQGLTTVDELLRVTQESD
jgi:general secretion pathway protein E